MIDSNSIRKITILGVIPFMNKETKEFYATRNKERPLYIVETTDLFIIVSEEKLAEWVCTEHRLLASGLSIAKNSS